MDLEIPEPPISKVITKNDFKGGGDEFNSQCVRADEQKCLEAIADFRSLDCEEINLNDLELFHERWGNPTLSIR